MFLIYDKYCLIKRALNVGRILTKPHFLEPHDSPRLQAFLHSFRSISKKYLSRMTTTLSIKRGQR